MSKNVLNGRTLFFNAGFFDVVDGGLGAEAAYYLPRKEYFQLTKKLFPNFLESCGPNVVTNATTASIQIHQLLRSSTTQRKSSTEST